MSSTKERILQAAQMLLEQDGDTVPSMSAVARAAGISRQALYLHFPDQAALLVALVAYVDEREDLAAGAAAVESAPDAAAQIRAWAHMQAWRNPRIAPLARALDRTRHAHQPASQAWRDRTSNRMRGAVAIVRKLRREGRLHRSWITTDAAALLWELTSFRVWDDLVNEAGIAPDRYVEMITATALNALAAPAGRRGPRPGTVPGPADRQDVQA